jgi:hypothetical protein
MYLGMPLTWEYVSNYIQSTILTASTHYTILYKDVIVLFREIALSYKKKSPSAGKLNAFPPATWDFKCFCSKYPGDELVQQSLEYVSRLFDCFV